MTVVVYLHWPERCFRVNESDLKYLKSLLPRKAEVIEVRSDRALMRELPRATHVITWHFRPEWYALAPKLKLVSTPAAGRELVSPPPQPVKSLNLHFGHYHGRFMAENVAAFCLAWARGFFLIDGTNPWPRTEISSKVFDLAGTKAVVFGYGNVGRAIGAKLEALGVEVSGYSRHRPLPRGRIDCDWFIAALPSTTGTDDLIDAKLLARLPLKCVLINVGRGNAVDEVALIRALTTKKLAGAYLDVIKHEPSGTVPLFRGATLDVVNTDPVKKYGLEGRLFLTPHSSAFSVNYLKTSFKELADDGMLHG